MEYLKRIGRGLWKICFVVNFITGLFVLYPLFYYCLQQEARFPKAFRLMRFWARWILFVPGIRVAVTAAVDLKKVQGPVIFCANHVSYLDIVVSYFIIPKYFIFMGKQELGKAPLFNIFFKRMNILVNRKSKIGSHRAFLNAAQEVDKGRSLFLFPEGTISKEAPKLKAFKNGAFKLAIEKQVPIVPITFLNNWQLLQNGGFFKSFGKPGIARVIIHSPIPTEGMNEEDLLLLRSQVYTVIDTALNNHYENRSDHRRSHRSFSQVGV